MGKTQQLSLMFYRIAARNKQSMSFSVVATENAAVCFVVPYLVKSLVWRCVTWLQDKPMYSIKFCRYLASMSGVALGLCLLVESDVLNLVNVGTLWSLQSPLHEARVWDVFIETSLKILNSFKSTEHSNVINFGIWCVACAAFVNSAFSILGWRSLGAVRGILLHLLITFYYCCATIFIVLLALWVSHWLNFWIFIVLFIAIEFRRREEQGARLSF